MRNAKPYIFLIIVFVITIILILFDDYYKNIKPKNKEAYSYDMLCKLGDSISINSKKYDSLLMKMQNLLLANDCKFPEEWDTEDSANYQYMQTSFDSIIKSYNKQVYKYNIGMIETRYKYYYILEEGNDTQLRIFYYFKTEEN